MEYFLSSSQRVEGRHSLGRNASRRCGFECLEPRQLLAADLAVADVSFGQVSFEQTGGATASVSGSVVATPSTAGCDSHATAAGLADVRVQLLDDTGAVLEESSTDASGAYHFADLIPGEYAVRKISEATHLQGASHVGDGGGISVGSNQMGEIVLQAGETLGGYDFCHFTNATAESVAQILPFLTLSLQSASATPVEIFAEPVVEQVADVAIAGFSRLDISQPAEVFYGGSSQAINKPADIKAWDESPLDGYFSTASFLELATTELPATRGLESMLRESMLRESILGESIFDENAPGSDDGLAEGPTVNTPAWWEIDAQSELAELLSDTEVIDLAIEAAGVAPDEAVVEIALLSEGRLTHSPLAK